MAELYLSWKQYEMPTDAGGNISTVYDRLVDVMKEQGWAGVQHQEDVHGYQPGIDLFAAIVFLYIGGQNFWQVIAVGGDATAEQAQQEIQELQVIIANLFVTL
jgi:hypothetical protein